MEEEKAICPECEQNKHANCDGTAMVDDEFVDCQCVCQEGK